MKKKWLISLGLAGSMMSAVAVPNDLIDQLSNENYETRTKAYNNLKKWASKASKADINGLKEAKNKAVSPETKMRIDSVIETSVFQGVPNTRGFIGISMDPVMGGVIISQIHKNTAAEKSGLKVGDKIVKIDKLDLSKLDVNNATMALSNYVKGKLAGQRLKVDYERGGERKTLELKLSDYNKFMKNNPQQGIPQGFQQLNIRPRQGRVQIFPAQPGGFNKKQDRQAALRAQLQLFKQMQKMQNNDNNEARQKMIDQMLKQLQAQLEAEQKKNQQKKK